MANRNKVDAERKVVRQSLVLLIAALVVAVAAQAAETSNRLSANRLSAPRLWQKNKPVNTSVQVASAPSRSST